MAIGNVGGADAGELQGHYFVVQQTKEPAKRADKAFRLIGPPIHGLGPGKRADLPGKLFAKNLLGGAAGPVNEGAGILAFWGCNFLQRRDCYTGFPGKGLCRRARLAIREGCLPGRPGKLFLHVELPGEHAFGAHGKPAWGGVAGDCSARRGQQALPGKHTLDAGCQFRLRRCDHARGDLFQAYFQ
jgi:hypothetical protein